MSALKKTMEWIGFRDPAADELEEYDAMETFDTPDFSAPAPARDYEPVASFPTPTNVKPLRREGERSIMTVTPRTYNEAKPIGDAFRNDTPVIMNLESMSESEARRMVDFASGLIYALNGSIERVTNRVFLLTPESVDLREASPRSNDHGIFNQS